MTAKTETERYAEIVSEVKADMASKAHTGDETLAEIAKRWAKAKATAKN